MGDNPNFCLRELSVFLPVKIKKKNDWRETREENALGLEVLPWDFGVDNEATRLQSSSTGATDRVG